MKLFLILASLLLLAAALGVYLLDRYIAWLVGPELDPTRDALGANETDYRAKLIPCPTCRATKLVSQPCWNCDNQDKLHEILARDRESSAGFQPAVSQASSLRQPSSTSAPSALLNAPSA